MMEDPKYVGIVEAVYGLSYLVKPLIPINN